MIINNLSVEINGMSVRAQIGVPVKERVYHQPLLIDVKCLLENVRTTDAELKSTYDYVPLRKEIIRIAETTQFRLLESLACEIAKFALSDDRISKVTISIKKPARFTDTQAVGITATFNQKEF